MFSNLNSSQWHRYAISMMVLQGIIYGFLDPFSKLTFMQVPVVSFLAVRYFLAALIMFLLWSSKIIRELREAKLKNYLFPALCMASTFIFSNSALQYTSVANVAFIRALSALIAPLLLVLFFHKRLTPLSIGNLFLMLLGLYLLCADGEFSGFGMGEFLSLLSATAMACALVFGKQALNYVSSITLSCFQLFCSIWMCLGVGYLQGSIITTSWEKFTTPLVGGTLLYSAIFCSIGGYMLQNIALEHISSKLVGMLQCLYPVITSIVAFFVIGEALSPIGFAGAAAIIISVIIESNLKD